MKTTLRGAARAPARARTGYLHPKAMHGHGYQPPHRSTGDHGRGRLLFHAIGCRTDGGPGLPPGVCLKCADHSMANAFYRELMRGDRRAG